MKKKKVLFVCYGLGIGGIETCLVNLLNALPESKFDIDVLLMNPEYECKQRIKTSIQYLDSFCYVMNTTNMIEEIRKRGGILKNFGKFISYCCFRIRVKLQISAWKSFKRLPDHYDIAIAYSQNDYSPYYVIDKVDADRKVMWYHNGAYEKVGKKYERDKKYYNKFNFVVAVSSDCKKILQSKFEFPDGKLIVLHNISDASTVRDKSELFIPPSFDEDNFHIVTVGRLTKEKGVDLAVEVCKMLCDKGIPIKWHWVGNGNQRATIENKVKEYGLQQKFIFEGNQSNPYPYIKCADVYVQPSYYEAYSTTVTEAKILQKPIVVTDVGGMRDQLVDKKTGIIVSISTKQIEEAILLLLSNRKLCKNLIHELNKETHIGNYLDYYYASIFA
ncbi:glycosyltransferase [Anaerostipes faecalis]|uniref:glycosyltransferase n=1 Tax=Anaerostipes faecalis TaxID=2738446 RepID=UPI003F003E55